MKRRIITSLLFVLLVISLAGCNIRIRAEVPYVAESSYEQLRINTIATVEQSVVVVKTETGHGSGLIFKREVIEEATNTYLYYVMTNQHVVDRGGEMKIYFGPSLPEINAKDVASNALYDIAVVRFESTANFRVHNVAPINDNTISQIVKGQEVIAIGTPRDLDFFNYTTNGIVSLPAVKYNTVPGLAFMHNAAINPGNSGGPVFNLRGDLIGVNVAKIATTNSSTGIISAEGLFYALSINKLAPIIRAFTESSYTAIVRSPRLGITVQEVHHFLGYNDPGRTDPNPDMDQAERERRIGLLPTTPVGVVVIGFDLTRNAHLVMEEYDLIYEMNGSAVTSRSDIVGQLANANFGDSHTLKVWRKVGSTFQSFTVTIVLS
jgi:serine protease Do